jgi:hypothetical protein
MKDPATHPPSESESQSPTAGEVSSAAAATIADTRRAVAELRGEFDVQAEKTEELLHAIAQAVLRIEEKLTESLPAQEPPAPLYESAYETAYDVQSPASTGDGAQWGPILLGYELGEAPHIEAERETLLADMRSGQQAALGLIGQLLLFRSATAERLSPLLKDIGEAYYRWEAESAGGCSGFRDEIIRWLQNTCAAAGLPNSIELVRPGDRFDASRHNARERGAEVVRVSGWVVLRDNGKVYTKANVAVR